MSSITEKNIIEFNKITIMFYDLNENTNYKKWKFKAFWETFINNNFK